MIEIIDESGLWNEEMQNFAQKVILDCLLYLQLPVLSELSLTVVTEEEIRQINKEQRQIDAVTDVLSFPMLDFAFPMDEAAFLEENDYFLNPESGRLFLGDIVLCFKRAEQQAEEYGHSLQREVAFLIVHSILHLLGYDHLSPEEEEEMFAKQEEILNHLKIYR